MKKVIVSLISAIFLFSACVGKNFKKPEVEIPQNQMEQTIENKDTQINKDISAFETEKWWHIFQDTVLDKFEEEALKYNYDLKIAMARVQEAKLNLSVAQANYYPTINVSGQITDSKFNKSLRDYNIYASRFAVGISASYEFDLWGKYWRNSEVAKSTFLSTQAEKDAVQLTLTATVAQAYFQYMALDCQLEIAKNTLKSRQNSFEVYSNRFKKGVISEFDLKRVEAEMEFVRAQVYTVEEALKKTESSLSVLIGRSPKKIVENSLEKGNKIKDTIVIPEIPMAIPSDLLSRRPDIKAQEYNLKASNAKVGTAKAILFPAIFLTGKAGFASYELENLFEKDSDTWSYSGDIVWTIFSGGKNMKTYETKKAQYEQMLSLYHKTVQTAFKETLDSINTYSLAKGIVKSKQAQTLALQKAYELALKREKAGLTDLLDVLDVERTLLQSEMDLVSARQYQLNAVVDICKVLGGGWTEKDGFKNK